MLQNVFVLHGMLISHYNRILGVFKMYTFLNEIKTKIKWIHSPKCMFITKKNSGEWVAQRPQLNDYQNRMKHNAQSMSLICK